jgi:hypothetical protein
MVMFRFAANPFVSFALIAATAFAGVVPVVGACTAKEIQCGAEQCCNTCCTGPDVSAQTCCSKVIQSHGCRCSVENERPATPQERRTSDERNNVRLVQSVVAAVFVADDESRLQLTDDATLYPFLPTSRRQAVLCRWLT